MKYTITFRVPATEAERVAPAFTHAAESPVIDGNNKIAKPAREAGKVLKVTSSSENVAKIIAEVLAKDFDEVTITAS